MPNIGKRLKAIVRNAVVWGAGWGVLGTLITYTLGVTGVVDHGGLLDSIGMGVRIGIVGGVAGALFSALISVAYRGKRIEDISWVKFGLGGATVSAIALPLFMQSASIITGGGMVAWKYLYTDIGLFAVFGGVAAALSMKLAQLAASRDGDVDDASLDEPESTPLLNAVDVDIPFTQREGAGVSRSG